MVPESAKGNIVNTLVSVRRQLALLNEKGAVCFRQDGYGFEA